MRRLILIFIGVCASLLYLNLPDAWSGDNAKLKSMAFGFRTTTNDKDADTLVTAEVLCNGHVIAAFSGFNSNTGVDKWDDDSNHGPWVLPISENPNKGALNECVYRVTISAAGNVGDDEWHFEPFLHADFDNSPQRNWHWLGGSLNSLRHAPVSQAFSLSTNHDWFSEGILLMR